MSDELFAQLDRIFHPRAIAVIGASATPMKTGNTFLKGFVEAGFKDVYPVNPHEQEILGLKAYPSVTEVPAEVDYAIIATPIAAAFQAVSECVEKGVAGVAMFTSGFREKSQEGAELEQRLVALARQGKTRIIGPNCMGIYCPSSRLVNFLGMSMVSGSVSLISHSGSMVLYYANMIRDLGLAVSKAVSCGNESDLTAVDFLEYLGQDPQTEIILAYLEGIKDGRRFVRLAREISQKKPIIVLKGGLTERGARAAASHTGAMAGSREIWLAALHQAGITLARNAEEVADCLLALKVSSLPAGRRVVVISPPGGAAVTSSDSIVENGLALAELSEETKNRVQGLMPEVGTSVDNPLDLGTSGIFVPNLYFEATSAAAADPNADIVLSISPGGSLSENAAIKAKGLTSKPIVVAAGVFGPTPSADEYKAYSEAGIPVIRDPWRAAWAMSALADRADFLGRAPAQVTPVYEKLETNEVIAKAQCEGREALSEYDSKRLLATYGVPVTKEDLSQSRRHALAMAERIGFPVGLKACGSDIRHKTELGLVELGLRDANDAGAAYDRLMARVSGMILDGILVQEMVKGEREFVAGLVQDRQFGSCVMFGLGGIFTEAVRDVTFRVAPFDRSEALAMISEIAARALLGPFRRGEPVDVEVLADILMTLSRLAFEQEAVGEVDLNPLIIGPGGRPVVVDALVVLK